MSVNSIHLFQGPIPNLPHLFVCICPQTNSPSNHLSLKALRKHCTSIHVVKGSYWVLNHTFHCDFPAMKCPVLGKCPQQAAHNIQNCDAFVPLLCMGSIIDMNRMCCICGEELSLSVNFWIIHVILMFQICCAVDSETSYSSSCAESMT